MTIFDINTWEFVVLIVIAVVVLGPERLPEYAAKLAKLVRRARGMADVAKTQLREQMGPEFDEVDWQQFDPRRYDPRRIVKEALLDDTGFDDTVFDDPLGLKPKTNPPPRDPDKPTPYDVDAT
jgi:sec-independent protein translocase protein TatB